jgi:NTE family protein
LKKSQKINSTCLDKIHTLIVEGGSTKGYAYPFALEELERLDVIKLSEIKTLAGSSAGAIAVAFLGCGASAKKLKLIMSDVDFAAFEDDRVGIVRDIWNLCRHFGYCDGIVLENWLKEVIRDLTGNAETKIGDLDKDLHITGSNLSRGLLEIFNRRTAPHMPIWKAIRISASIPLFYRPVIHKGSYYVDGGLLCNFPDLPGNGGELGLRLVGDNEYSINRKIAKIKGIRAYLGVIIDTMMHSAEMQHVSKELWKNTISINTGNIGATEFSLNDTQKQFLANQAKIAVQKFLKRL